MTRKFLSQISPWKSIAILALGAVTNILVAWWLALAPANPWLLYPAGWYEYPPGPKTPATRLIFREMFPAREIRFHVKPLIADPASGEPHRAVFTNWGESRAGRIVTEAQVLESHPEISIEDQARMKLAIREGVTDWESPSYVPSAIRAPLPRTWIADDVVTRLAIELPLGTDLNAMNASPPSAFEFATGWPFRSMSLGYHSAGQNSPTLYFALEVPKSIRDAIQSDTLLPLRPLPLGFAINTLFYAALILIPWELAGWGVRARRRRRALCPRCAHSLAGLPTNAPCPECGTPPKHGTKTASDEPPT